MNTGGNPAAGVASPHAMQHQMQQNSDGTASSCQQGQLSGRGTSSGPTSSYSGGYSSGADPQSTGTGGYSQQGGYTSSSGQGTTQSSLGGYYAPPGPVPSGMVGHQPGSGGPGGYGPPSSMMGGAGGPAGAYMMSSSGPVMHGGQLGVGYAPTSSNAPSAYSGSIPSTAAYNSGGQGACSYPAMAPVGSQPLPPHGPMSSGMGGPMSMAPPGMLMHGSYDPAAQSDAARLAQEAATDVGAMGDRGILVHFRPKIGDKLVCTCPMVCLVNASRGVGHTVPHAVPLETAMLRYDVQCHIGQAFVDLLLVCEFKAVSCTTWLAG